MLIPTIMMVFLAGILFAIGRYKGQHMSGLKSGLTMTLEILPLLILAFTVAIMVQGLLPHQLLSKWGGAESGIREMLNGSIAVDFTAGYPLCEFANRCRADNLGALYRCEMKAD